MFEMFFCCNWIAESWNVAKSAYIKPACDLFYYWQLLFRRSIPCWCVVVQNPPTHVATPLAGERETEKPSNDVARIVAREFALSDDNLSYKPRIENNSLQVQFHAMDNSIQFTTQTKHRPNPHWKYFTTEFSNFDSPLWSLSHSIVVPFEDFAMSLQPGLATVIDVNRFWMVTDSSS